MSPEDLEPNRISDRFRKLDARLRRACADEHDPETLARRVQQYGDAAGGLLLAADQKKLWDGQQLWARMKEENLPLVSRRLAAPGQYPHVVFIGAIRRWLYPVWRQRLEIDPAFLIHFYDAGPGERFYLMFWPRESVADRHEQLKLKQDQATLYARACSLLADLADPAREQQIAVPQEALAASLPAVETVPLSAESRDQWWGPLTKKSMSEALHMTPAAFRRYAMQVGLIQENARRWYINVSRMEPGLRRKILRLKPVSGD